MSVDTLCSLLAKQRKARTESIRARVATRISNRAAIENGRAMVSELWQIVAATLTEDRRDEPFKYLFLPNIPPNAIYPAQQQPVEDGASDDPYATLVVEKRYQITQEPTGMDSIEARARRVVLGFIDAVITVDGFAMFGVRRVKGALVRNKQPFLTSEGIDSPRPDSLDYSVLCERVEKMLPRRTTAKKCDRMGVSQPT